MPIKPPQKRGRLGWIKLLKIKKESKAHSWKERIGMGAGKAQRGAE